MKIVSAEEMREIDQRTVRSHGVSYLQLMENAAARLVQYVREQVGSDNRPVVVLCGKGNNGGDGLAFARLWRETTGNAPHVVLFTEPSQLRGDAAENYRRLGAAGIAVAVITRESDLAEVQGLLSEADCIVDALLGTGLRGEAEGLIAAAIEKINERNANALCVAVDIPSGLNSGGKHEGGVVVRADHTLTFTAPKRGLVADGSARWVGRLAVAQIGSPWRVVEEASASQWRWLEPMEFRPLRLERKRDAHKGDFGHVLIAAGSRGKTGAAGLAGMGSLRSGAGLTTVATPESLLGMVAGYAPEYMTEPLAETDMGTVSLRCLEYGRFEALLQGKSALALGPGLSTVPETQEFVRTVVRRCPLPVILDADGLNAYAGRADELRQRASPWLAVTPHPGEMARLCGLATEEVQARRSELALACAGRWNAHVILKGYHTLIATPSGELFVNPAGTPALASGGTGDVLTGVLAGVTAQFGTANWGRVLGYGVYLHGCAGQVAEARGACLASDVALAVQRVRSELSQRPRDESTLPFC